MSQYFFKGPGPKFKGLVWIATPNNTELKYMKYGRIRLSSNESLNLQTGSEEFVFLTISGESKISANSKSFKLRKHCALYVPRDTETNVLALTDVDIAVFSAPAEKRYTTYFANIDEILGRSDKHKVVGKEPARREVITLIGEDVSADRLLVGVTWTMKGNWSSWPPHRHGDILEEVYVFYDMPKSAFGIQLVYDDFDDIKYIGIVRNGDAVVIPRGYHPNVAAPGFVLKYIWAMCALRPRVDRVYGKVKVQEGYG